MAKRSKATPTKAKLLKKWNSLISDSKRFDPVFLCRGIDSAPEIHATIGAKLSCIELSILLKTVTEENILNLFANIWDESSHYFTMEQHNIISDILRSYHCLCSALSDVATTCMHRRTLSWFEDSTPSELLNNRQEKYRQSLKRNSNFNKEIDELAKIWPDGLLICRNPYIPHFTSSSFNPGQPILAPNIREHIFSSDAQVQNANSHFTTAARIVLTRWALSFISRDGQGHIIFQPTPAWCSSDILGQGTYIFVPSYMSFRSLTSEKGGDVASIRTFIDQRYKAFSPSKETFSEKVQRLVDYIRHESKIDNPTLSTTKRLLDKWVLQEYDTNLTEKQHDRYLREVKNRLNLS